MSEVTVKRKTFKTTCRMMAVLGSLTLAAPSIASPDNLVEIPPGQAPVYSDQQKLSYAIGVVFGSQLLSEANNLDMEVFNQGLRDSYTNSPLKLSDREIKQAFQTYQKAKENARTKQEQAFETLASDNYERSQAFLKENLSRQEVNELVPGLQYQTTQQGDGKSPGLKDQVVLHYKGSLLDGKVFDSSYAAGAPVEFIVEQGPSSWIHALPNMKEGSVWTIWVSPELGFGSGGAGPVGPNEVLEYQIELIKVNPQG